jgi:hypothetical protein
LRIRRYPVRVRTQSDRCVIDLEIPLFTTPGWPAPAPAGTVWADGRDNVALTLTFTEILSQTPAGEDHFVLSEELRVDGRATVTSRGASLEGNLSGEITYWPDTAAPARASCTSDRHDFYLRPR